MKSKFLQIGFLIFVFSFVSLFDAEARRIKCCKRIKREFQREVKDIKEGIEKASKEIDRAEDRFNKEMSRLDPTLQKALAFHMEGFRSSWMDLREWIQGGAFKNINSFEDVISMGATAFRQIMIQHQTAFSDCKNIRHGSINIQCFPDREGKLIDDAVSFLENDPHSYRELGFGNPYEFLQTHVKEIIWAHHGVFGIANPMPGASKNAAAFYIKSFKGGTIFITKSFFPGFVNAGSRAAVLVHEAKHNELGHTCGSGADRHKNEVYGTGAQYGAKVSVLGHPQFEDCHDQEKTRFEAIYADINHICTNDKVFVERHYPRPCEVSNPPAGSTLAQPVDSVFTPVGNVIADFSEELFPGSQVSLAIADDDTKFAAYFKNDEIFVDILGPRDSVWKKYASRKIAKPESIQIASYKNDLYLAYEAGLRMVVEKFDPTINNWKFVVDGIGRGFFLGHKGTLYLSSKNKMIDGSDTVVQESSDGVKWTSRRFQGQGTTLFVSKDNAVCLGDVFGPNLTQGGTCTAPKITMNRNTVDVTDDILVRKEFKFLGVELRVVRDEINPQKDQTKFPIPFKHFYNTVSVSLDGKDLGPIFPCKYHRVSEFLSHVAVAVKDNKIYILYKEEGVNKSTGRRIRKLLLKETSL